MTHLIDIRFWTWQLNWRERTFFQILDNLRSVLLIYQCPACLKQSQLSTKVLITELFRYKEKMIAVVYLPYLLKPLLKLIMSIGLFSICRFQLNKIMFSNRKCWTWQRRSSWWNWSPRSFPLKWSITQRPKLAISWWRSNVWTSWKSLSTRLGNCYFIL